MPEQPAAAESITTGQSASLVLLDASELLIEGFFHELLADRIAFAPKDGAVIDADPLSGCLVLYANQQRACVFFTHVLGQGTKEDDLPLLYLMRPSDVHQVDRRAVFRVPLLEGHGLAVSITRDGASAESVEPLDLSFLGIRVRSTSESPVRRGERINVKLERHDSELSLRGQVKNMRGDDMGIMFDHAATGETEQIPATLRALVMDLQRHWLQNRTKTS